jgi:hypothetical protein
VLCCAIAAFLFWTHRSNLVKHKAQKQKAAEVAR